MTERSSTRWPASGLKWMQPFRTQSVERQARIAVVLLALIPALSFFYIGVSVSGSGGHPVSVLIVLLCTGVVAVAGWLVFRRYSKNIGRLRHYVMEIADGTLPAAIRLYEADSSDDLRCIESGLNVILQELENRIHLIEHKLEVEFGLRRELEQQQQVLLEAERQRVMMQSLGAACHHLGQPATALRLRLHLMRERARSDEEVSEIEASLRDAEAMDRIFTKLREVNEYRTEPYLISNDPERSRILAI